jgi:hypothetical protein
MERRFQFPAYRHIPTSGWGTPAQSHSRIVKLEPGEVGALQVEDRPTRGSYKIERFHSANSSLTRVASS